MNKWIVIFCGVVLGVTVSVSADHDQAPECLEGEDCYLSYDVQGCDADNYTCVLSQDRRWELKRKYIPTLESLKRPPRTLDMPSPTSPLARG